MQSPEQLLQRVDQLERTLAQVVRMLDDLPVRDAQPTVQHSYLYGELQMYLAGAGQGRTEGEGEEEEVLSDEEVDFKIAEVTEDGEWDLSDHKVKVRAPFLLENGYEFPPDVRVRVERAPGSRIWSLMPTWQGFVGKTMGITAGGPEEEIGKGTVEVWRRLPTAPVDEEILVPTGISVQVWNMAGEVGEGWVQCKIDLWGDAWVDVERC